MRTLYTYALWALFFSYSVALTIPSIARFKPLNTQYSFPEDSFPDHYSDKESSSTFEQWLQEEEETALSRLLANIAPGGLNTAGAAPGTVIASPSREHPNYYYQWVRDAAITTSSLVNVYSSSPSSPTTTNITSLMAAYTTLQRTLQTTSNPSGSFSDLSSLGEPKFLVSGAPFTGSWGRPQTDGPALRALTLMRWLHTYNTTHPSLWAHRFTSTDASDFFNTLYAPALPPASIIKADLEYVSHHWHLPSFDLWEEIRGSHLFTMSVQQRALRSGAALARAFNDPAAAEWYDTQADSIRALLLRFWDSQRNHLISMLDQPSRSGLDCSVLLASLHGSQEIFLPWSDEVLKTLLALARDMQARYPINWPPSSSKSDSHEPLPPSPNPMFPAVALGRYPEDVYTGDGTASEGGNPWFLCTASAAEILYRTAHHLQNQSQNRNAADVVINATALDFWQHFLPFAHTPTANTEYLVIPEHDIKPTSSNLIRTADLFLSIVRAHADASYTPDNHDRGGRLSEQFDRYTGFERGARDLTWSYASLLEAARWRERAREAVGEAS
ncbi:MAG: hypothetical protein M1819_001228 [Sarea resinae]|nr:MAG: hypothetical protein M1819_001228 [Sarea resinae]